MTKTTDWIQTYTGKRFYPLEPDADLICIKDIAHSLSMQCRFNGHTAKFYSVAEHSVKLSREFFCGWHYKLAALLHDASEAYLSDIPRPIKHEPSMWFYRVAEKNLQTMIFDKFCPGWEQAEKDIKKNDALILAHECHTPTILAAGCEGFTLVDIHPEDKLTQFDHWPPDVAEHNFLSEYQRLQVRLEEAR